MENEIRIWLYDIFTAIMEIESFINTDEVKLEEYKNDIRIKKAVERNLEMIFEALRRVLRKDSLIEVSNARNFVGVRNRIIHGYDTVSDEIVYGIVEFNLPILRQEITTLLLVPSRD